ncbi:PspC domain-containing protein [Exiguobacterium flavidum]|uniref:PspC domain-containing protein n=1 Tax=Exiguobacterium flavidum TaxID=2184695 RepID=UPI000DF7DE25|nr:PspC domain-containing protein [Exiguobacterium flavidum]
MARQPLYKDPDNAAVAGVCAGLARYLDIDTVIVRVIFIALTLLGGPGLLIYIILALVMKNPPKAVDPLRANEEAF